jgi:hypothetical protein
MAITFVSSGEQITGSDATPITYTVDIGTRTNGLLLVFVGTIDTATHTHSTPTWNGVAMGLAASQIVETVASTTFQRLSIYYLSNPANGSNTFSLAYSDGGTNTAAVSYVVAAWFDGAHQTQASVLDQFDDNETGSTDPSVAITPGTNNQLVVGFYASEANAVLTSAQTLIQDADHGARVMGASYVIQTTATTSTMSWTGVDDVWLAIGASFKEAASGSQEITPNLISSTESVYQPAVTATVTVTPNLISSAATVYQPAISVGSVTISPNLIASTEVVYQPAVTGGSVAIVPNFINSTGDIYQVAVSVGSVTISPNFIASTETVYQIVITSGLLVLPNVITSTATVYQPAITTGSVTVSPNLIASGEVVYQPSLSGASAQVVSMEMIVSGAVVYQVVLALYNINVRRTLYVEAENRTLLAKR